MDNLNLSASEVLAWNHESATRWQHFLTAHPDLLQLPCDIAGAKNLAELLRHIVVVELRNTERLSGRPLTNTGDIPCTLDAMFAVHRKAHEAYSRLLADAAFDWSRVFEFESLAGKRWRPTAKKMFFHANLHSIRHYTQLHALVRENGFKTGWLGDLIDTDTMA